MSMSHSTKMQGMLHSKTQQLHMQRTIPISEIASSSNAPRALIKDYTLCKI